VYTTPGGRLVTVDGQRRYVYALADGRAGDEPYDGPRTKVADSQKEFRRLLELRAEETAGKIFGLRPQPAAFRLVVNGVLIGRYKPDFLYFRHGKLVIEDVKGKVTELFKWKRRLMKALHNITILET
jgi:hypothetical protein